MNFLKGRNMKYSWFFHWTSLSSAPPPVPYPSTQPLSFYHNFSLLISGTITLFSRLDRETEDSYSLVVLVSDGGIDGQNVLNDTTRVNVRVLDINEFAPEFQNVSSFELSIVEEVEHADFYRVCLPGTLVH